MKNTEKVTGKTGVTVEESKKILRKMKGKSQEEKIQALFKRGMSIKDITFALNFGPVYKATYGLRHAVRKTDNVRGKKRKQKIAA